MSNRTQIYSRFLTRYQTLAGIDTIEQANSWLSEYLREHNGLATASVIARIADFTASV
mgnify:CR=1 FL=1